MGDVNWNYELKDGQSENPVVMSTLVDLPKGFFYPKDEDLFGSIFKTDGTRLRTWGRKKGKDGKVMWQNSPHWIGTRRGTPLHTDELYPRYTHQLKVRVDDGIYCRGLNKNLELKLERGLFYILDTHSPHQVFRKNDDALWNISVSIDSYDILDAKDTICRCINFAFNNSVW